MPWLLVTKDWLPRGTSVGSVKQRTEVLQGPFRAERDFSLSKCYRLNCVSHTPNSYIEVLTPACGLMCRQGYCRCNPFRGCHTGVGWPLIPYDWCMTGETGTDAHTGRATWAGWREATTGQGSSRHQQGGPGQALPRYLRGQCGPADTLISRTVREELSVVEAVPFVVLCPGSPWTRTRPAWSIHRELWLPQTCETAGEVGAGRYLLLESVAPPTPWVDG